MKTINKRLHLITLPADCDQDLLSVRQKAECIALFCQFSPLEVEQVTSCTIASVEFIRKRLLNSKTWWFIVRNAQGEYGIETIFEGQYQAGHKDECIEKEHIENLILDLQKGMSLVETEDLQKSFKIIAIKWGHRVSIGKVFKGNPTVEELISDTNESCLENLKIKHEELLHLLKERDKQNEELDRLNIELFHLNRDLETAAAERAMNEIALQIAHKIRNPVTMIGGLAKSFLKSLPVDEKTGAKIRAILEQVRKLEEIVPEFEKLASHRIHFFAPVDLIAITLESVNTIRRDFNDKQVLLQLDVEQGPFMLKANEGMLKVALTHIHRNALTASESGKAVTTRIFKELKHYVIQVEDNGIGIPPDKMTHIFEPFFTTKPSRVGLGLPIVKQIIEEHNGQIDLESEVGKGTLVTLRLPVRYLPGASLKGQQLTLEKK